MKVLLCTNAFERVTNGPAKFAHLLLQLNTFHPEFEVRVLTEDTTSSIPDHVYKQSLHIPRYLKPLGMFIRMFAYHKSAMKIRKRDFAFDLLIYNNAIVGLRSAITFKNTIGFINDDNNASVSWKAGFFKFRWNRKHVFFITEWLSTKLMTKIITNSHYLESYLITRYNSSKQKIKQLYKAIEFNPENPIRNNAIPHILFVKNDYHRGGLFVLIAALNTLNTPIKLTIVGPPESIRQEIETKANSPLLTIDFKGITNQQTVYGLMRTADIFCVPSYKEALGVANIEAMALGCTLISTRIGGIPEVLADGENGWLVEPGNHIALAEAIKTSIDNQALSDQKRLAAQNFAAHFSQTNMFNNLIKILKTLE